MCGNKGGVALVSNTFLFGVSSFVSFMSTLFLRVPLLYGYMGEIWWAIDRAGRYLFYLDAAFFGWGFVKQGEGPGEDSWGSRSDRSRVSKSFNMWKEWVRRLGMGSQLKWRYLLVSLSDYLSTFSLFCVLLIHTHNRQSANEDKYTQRIIS
ncbi:hypothetical protein QBC34DRAFT_64726 [Podospora aff. communis PSN243]|uniref:Uncharacterized protein n=1 Tax=Podospora aff. communis PSN243 TaxID=3040156 RepID=A0AAV9GPJ5_9PEZI|nr:hypothetical protein QBC34DRAFT_64726 [Podospora aff. communis PSN243]